MGFWETIKGFFGSIHDTINNFLQRILDIDGRLLSLYDEFVMPLPELVKIAGIVFLTIIIVLGVLSFAKKMLKLLIILAIIFFVIMALTRAG